MEDSVKGYSALGNNKRHSRLLKGQVSADITPQILHINDIQETGSGDSSKVRARSGTVASSLNNVGFKSIINSNGSVLLTTATTASNNMGSADAIESSSSSNKRISNNVLFKSDSNVLGNKKKSMGRLNGFGSTTNSLASSKSFLVSDEEDNSSKKSKNESKAKKKLFKLFGRNKDDPDRRTNDFKHGHDAESVGGKMYFENSSIMEPYHFSDLLSFKDPDYELVNISKILNSNGNNSHLGNSTPHSKNTTVNLDHLMKQDAMLSEREYHYMYDLLKNYDNLATQFVHLKLNLRNKVLNNMVFIINDINYAVINNDHMLPKMENLHKIILLFIKLSFVNFSIEYDSESQNSPQNDKSAYNSASYRHGNGQRPETAAENVFSYQGAAGNGVSVQTLAPLNGRFLEGIFASTTSAALLEVQGNPHKLEATSKKCYQFIIKFYNKIFKDLVYMVENQLIYENNDEKILNNSIKRLNLIWYNFNSHYIPNIMILNHDFDVFTKTYLAKFNLQNKKSDLKTLLLEIFRDCVIMPIFENYDALYFKQFLLKQQDLHSSDKLVFLQCLGLLQLGIHKEVEDKSQSIINMLISVLRESMIVNNI